MQKDPSIARKEALREIMEVIESILEKEEGSLTAADIGFLRARRSYLTSDQIHKYPSAFPERAAKKPVEPAPSEQTNQEPTQSKSEVSYKDLQKQAQALGMAKVVGKSQEELEDFILSKS